VGAQESIHTALTISTSIDRHTGELRKCTNAISSKTGHVRKVASGTRSGDIAVRLLDVATGTINKSITVLENASSQLKAYAQKIQNS